MYSDIHYDLIFKIKNYKYNGIIKILFKNDKITNKILLDSHKIKITQIKINNKIIKTYKISTDHIIINHSFVKQKYEIIVHFNNDIKNNITGLYYSKIKDDIIYSTDFEPEDARYAFPSFDSPLYKATFQLILFYDKKYIALSNTSEQNTYIKNDLKITVFEKTPVMSSYLLCFVIGDLHKISYNNLSAYCHSSINKEYMDFSLQKLVKGFNFYNKYYKISYPIKKLDIVCIPEFESSAMENWGLITFRDTSFLVDKYYPELSKLSIENTINHELVHQWFGNFVSVKNWDNLWLNESFAEYMSNYVNNNFNKSVLDDYSRALYDDAFNSSKPIYNEKYKNKKQIFNTITYSKGACVLRYIENFIGGKEFHEVVIKYLKKYEYSNTETDDFINMLPDNKLCDPKILMKDLINNRGYPIIRITKNNHNYKIDIKMFNIMINNFDEMKPYPYNIVLEIKHKTGIKKYLLNSKKELIVDEEIILVNPNNVLLCALLYEDFKPDIKNMNNIEILGYLCNLNILLLHNEEMFEFINVILLQKFDIFIITKIYRILLDIKKILNIKKMSALKIDKLVEIKKNIEKILKNTKDAELLDKLVDILTKVYDEDIDKYTDYLSKKYLYKMKIQNSNTYEELLHIYKNTDIPSYYLYVPEILCLNEKIYNEIIKTLQDNKKSIIRIQDIIHFINLFLHNFPEYIDTFLLFLSKNV